MRQTSSFKPPVPNLELFVQNKSDGKVIKSWDFGRTKPLGSQGFNALCKMCLHSPCPSLLQDIPACKVEEEGWFLLSVAAGNNPPRGSACSSAPWGVPENPSKRIHTVVQLPWKSQLWFWAEVAAGSAAEGGSSGLLLLPGQLQPKARVL